MEAVKENKKKVHQGRNIRIARNFQNMTQGDLAFKLNLSQGKVSDLELKETLEDELLDKFAAALNISVDFLKNFEPEEVMKSFTFSENAFTNNNAENSKGNVTQQIVGEQQNISNYNFPDNIKELYSQLLEEKDKVIESLEGLVSDLKAKGK
ncbi:MAG: helix-turn-helix domain-containing protein [Prevotella sp.]|jgi:transcriptional regulator with XRE-family HTH domain|nr:helix-turn-helix domain-containing protein [Prevotella sp.]